jgi:TolB protein
MSLSFTISTSFFKPFSLGLIFIFILCLLIGCPSDDVVIVPPDPPPPSNPYAIDFLPTLSPDGHTIAYYHRDSTSETTGIYLIDTNGTNKRLLIGDMAFDPDFSPDGNWITFASGQIYKIKINGDSLTQLTNGGANYYPSWSPDGEWISYDSDFLDPTGSIVIWKVKKDTSIRRDISQHGTGEWRMSSWSPNGKKLVHQRYIVGNNGMPEIFIMDSSGQNSIRVTTNDKWDELPRFSPDGQKIAFTQEYQIYTINIDGTGLTKLSDKQGYSCDYSPDGEKIIFCDTSPGNGRLWIMNKEGSNKRQLTF